MYQSYLQMTKPGIVRMVLITATIGYVLGGGGVKSWLELLLMLVGTGLSASGSAVLNNYLERDTDSRMYRTRGRALPSGEVDAAHALSFGVLLTLSGVCLLVWKTNLLTGFIVLLTAFLYVLVYTPLKRVTWLNTTFGAIPGALPPVSGWAAATGDVELGSMVLFLILFAWQHPHFYAIAWMHREDYARAGFKMLPVVEPDGCRMFRHSVLYSVLLMMVSLLPVYMGMTGPIYLVGALVVGSMFLFSGIVAARSKSLADARKMLQASVIYLPVLLTLIVVDFNF